MGDVHKNVLAIHVYLKEGVTWRRLQSIATAPLAAGGLQLMREFSPQFKMNFGTAPPNIVDNRPETVAHFLLWLLPKEPVLTLCAEKDVTERSLGDSARVAVLALQDSLGRITRAVNACLLEKALFLFRWGKLHGHISKTTSLADLVDRCMNTITSLAVDDHFLKAFGLNGADIVTMDMVGRTWVEVLIYNAVADDTLRAQCQVDMLEYHRRISTRMSTHLQLTMANIARFAWMLGGVLDSDPTKAQQCARLAHQDLLTKTATSPVAVAFASDSDLMAELARFGSCDPPVQVWKGGGAFRNLVYYLIPRFLANPDHVLDCEGVHARWQWLEAGKRNVKLKSLNSVLKLGSWITACGDLPPIDELLPHLQAVRASLRGQYAQVLREGEVASGLRQEYIYRDRFNLSLADVELLKGQNHRLGGGSSSPNVVLAKKGYTLCMIFVCFG